MDAEQPIFFECHGEQLLGILHRAPQSAADVGLLLVVGGPQYRVGSHRQFVLLARDLAKAGIPVLRFDYRGMGDSSGEARDFEAVTEDIAIALDTFIANVPGLSKVVTWGLCDAATANAFYALHDERVVGQIALNPWVRTVEGEAQAFIKHYYLKRVLSGDFWRKVLSFKFDPRSALSDFFSKLSQSRSGGTDDGGATADQRPLPRRLFDAQLGYKGRTLLILSGQDLTAKEYENRVAERSEWQQWLKAPTVEVRKLEDADHTFSTAVWRDQVATWSRDWILDPPE